MIVKIQLPVLSTDVQPADAFVYNEDRSVEFFLPVTGKLVDAMDGELRAFFEIYLEGDQCDILAKVEEQGW